MTRTYNTEKRKKAADELVKAGCPPVEAATRLKVSLPALYKRQQRTRDRVKAGLPITRPSGRPFKLSSDQVDQVRTWAATECAHNGKRPSAKTLAEMVKAEYHMNISQNTIMKVLHDTTQKTPKPTTKKPSTIERRNKVADELVKTGCPPVEAATRLKVSLPALYKRQQRTRDRVKAGLPITRPSGRPFKLSSDQVDQVRTWAATECAHNGKRPSAKTLAEMVKAEYHMNISQNTIMKVLRDTSHANTSFDDTHVSVE